MHIIDKHRRAVEIANRLTREAFGDDQVPCSPGSPAHQFWLSKFDQAYDQVPGVKESLRRTDMNLYEQRKDLLRRKAVAYRSYATRHPDKSQLAINEAERLEEILSRYEQRKRERN